MLVKAVRQANAKEDSLMDVAPKFNFMCLIMIMITFLVYNILLAKENTVLEYFTSQSNLIMHVILPIMFILNWVLFYEHGKIKWYYPLLSVIMPLVYVVFILIRAGILNGATWTVIYPYFFLNLDALGIGGFVAWILVLLVVFVVIGYVIYLLDNIKKFKKSKN